MDGWMDGWMDGRTDGRMDGWMTCDFTPFFTFHLYQANEFVIVKGSVQ